MAAKKKSNLPVKKRKRALNYQISRILKAAEFSPVEELILHVYPQLKPNEKMQVIFKMMDFLYPKPKAVETQPRKKGPLSQTNVQVNLPEGTILPSSTSPQTHADMVKLIEAAEGKKDAE